MTAVGFAVWTVFAFGFSWLVTRKDEQRERDFFGLFAVLMAVAVIIVLGKYAWPGPHNPDTDYR